jgi:hypothetical protein
MDSSASRTTRWRLTSTASARPALPLGLRRLVGHRLRDATTPRGSAMSVWPQRRAAPNRSRLYATAMPTPSGGLGSTNSRRRDASSTRSRPFYTKSSAWTPSHASDSLHRACLRRAKPVRGTTIDPWRRTFPCRASPAAGMAIGASAVRYRSTARPCTYAAGVQAGARLHPTCQWWRKRRRERRRTATFSAGVPEPCRCGHAAMRLHGAHDLRGATSAPAAKGAARSYDGTTSGELQLTAALRARAG